jgi:hypothetical protein
MKIIKMDNFDLKKYLVENKVTTNSQMLTEAEEISPEQAVNQAMKVLPKLEKSSEFDKLASKVAQDPELMQQLEKALSQAGISMNENIGELGSGDLKTLALNLAKKGMQMNEEEDDGTAVGAGFLAFAAGGTLAANFSAAIAAAVPVLGTLFAGPAVAGAIAGVALYALARKVYQKTKQKSGSQQDPNYLKNKFKDGGFDVS